MADWYYLAALSVGCLLAAVFIYLMYGLSVQEEREFRWDDHECYLCGHPIRQGEGYRHVTPDSVFLMHTYCPDDEEDEPHFLGQRPA